MPVATTHDRVRRGFTAGVVLAAAIGAGVIVRTDDGPPTDEQIASQQLVDSSLPFLGTAFFGTTTDFRDLEDPSEEVRAAFAARGSVYRVVTAERDRATLVVWQRTQLGAQPFERTRNTVGHGCVTLSRGQGGVQSEVVACPGPVGPMPTPDLGSWAAD